MKTDGRFRGATEYSDHPGTVRARARMATLSPEQKRAQLDKNNVLRALKQAMDECAKHRDFTRLKVKGKKRNLLMLAVQARLQKRREEQRPDPEVDAQEVVDRFMMYQANPDMRRCGPPSGKARGRRPRYSLEQSLAAAAKPRPKTEPKPETESKPDTESRPETDATKVKAKKKDSAKIEEVDRLVKTAHEELPDVKKGVKLVQERVAAIRARPVRVAESKIEEMMEI